MKSDETAWLEELLGFCLEKSSKKRDVDHGCAIVVQGLGFGFKVVFLFFSFLMEPHNLFR